MGLVFDDEARGPSDQCRIELFEPLLLLLSIAKPKLFSDVGKAGP